MTELLLIAFVVLVLILMLGGGRTFGPVFGWCWRSSWGFLVWLWTAPTMRLVLAAIGLFFVTLWWWWPALVGEPGIVWAGVVTATACALWGAAAGAIHHTSPNWWRGLAIGRTAGYVVLCGPLALSLGSAVTAGTPGTLLGVLAWALIAAGLVLHLVTGSEFRQAQTF